MITEISSGNLDMIRRKIYFPHCLINQMQAANHVLTRAVGSWGRNDVLRVDFAAFNQQVDDGDIH